jgi:predicted lipoprotein with Yx(FWY)xxD motif
VTEYRYRKSLLVKKFAAQKEVTMKSRNIVRTLLISACVFVFVGMFLSTSALAQAEVKKQKASPYTIHLQVKEGAGSYLVDSKGMSLYYFKKDMPSIGACINECLTKWPVFYTEKIVVKKPLKKKDFGVITRDDGQKQTTYKGWRLYYFFKDAKPGDMNGEGVNNVWYVIYPDKFTP